LISYLDTSLLVAACTNESKTPVVQQWLSAQVAAELAISRWVVTEISSALSLKLRTGRLTETERADTLAGFTKLWTESLRILPIAEAHFSTAARFADRHELGLRAGDALHLAICADHGAMLQTLDRRMADAGNALGVPTKLV
jgi:predicted nucleic acid-binding protein